MSNCEENNDLYAKISSAIRGYLCTVLGESSVKVIEYYLSKRCIDHNYIYTDPDNLQKSLALLFGDGSKILTIEIAKMLCNEFGIVLDDYSMIDLKIVVNAIAHKQGLDMSKINK
jgi:hypothetical protein